MTLSAAMEEAYAANPHDVAIIETIELDNAAWAAPVLVARGVDDDTLLPLALGETPLLHVAIPFTVILPGQGEDGLTPMKLRINDVDGVLTPYLEEASLGSEPISITYRAYRSDDLTEPGDVISGLFLSNVDQDPAGAEGTVSFQEIELQAFPLSTYDETFYPALQTD